MGITALLVMAKDGPSSDALILASSFMLSGKLWIFTSKAKEVIVFAARTIAKRTLPGQRLSIEQGEYTVHCHNRNGLCGLVVADKHYPSSFLVIRDVLDHYEDIKGSSWKDVRSDTNQAWPWLDEALNKYQDPLKIDKLLKVTKELEDTRVILHKTIDTVLERGEKLDILVSRSADLSTESKKFYDTSRKTNQCCSLG